MIFMYSGRRILFSQIQRSPVLYSIRQRSQSLVLPKLGWIEIDPKNNKEKLVDDTVIPHDTSMDAIMTKAVFGRESQIFVSTGLARIFRNLCLPVGYPESARNNYSLYVRYNLVQVSLISFTRILSTQAMLLAVGIGQPGALPMAAVINWLLKDGLGHLGSILVGTKINTKFDSDPKRYKFLSVFLGQCANLLGIASLSYPTLFLLFTSLSAALSRIGTLAVTASRARIYEDFSLRGNLGDLIRCSQSQSTVATLLGTVVGVGIAPLIGADITSILAVFVPASVATHYMAFKAVSVIELSTFNRQRFELVMDSYLSNDGKVPSYHEIARQEKFILTQSLFKKVVVNPPVKLSLVDSDTENNLRQFGYHLHQSAAGNVLLFIAEDASSTQVLEGMFDACSRSRGMKVGSFAQFISAAHQAGWRTHVAFMDDPLYRLSLVS